LLNSTKEFSTKECNVDSANSEHRILEELQNFESYYDQIATHQAITSPALPTNIRIESQIKLLNTNASLRKAAPKH
jgi:hypothetical protein